jgi:hypothetical protein
MSKLHSKIMNIGVNALHAASPRRDVQDAYMEGHELLAALKDLIGAVTHLKPCKATLDRANKAIAKAEA